MVFETEAEAKDAASKRAQALIGQSNQNGASLSDISTGVTQGDIKNINLIVKADTEGTAEALRDSLNKIHVEGAKVTVLHCNSAMSPRAISFLRRQAMPSSSLLRSALLPR